MNPHRINALAALSAVFALACAGQAESGNVATNSIGSVQASSITSSPAASTDTSPVTSAVSAVSAPVGITGDGDNTATGSIGTAQVGGANSATGSKASGQVSPTNLSPSASMTEAGHTVGASGNASAGSTPNSSRHRILTLQSGRPDAGATTTVDHKSITVSRSGLNTHSSGPSSSSGSLTKPSVATPSVGHASLGDESASASPVVQQNVAVDPKTATVRPSASVSPNVTLAIGRFAQFVSGGLVGLSQNNGDSADNSFGTVQAGALTAAPTLGVASPALGSAFLLGGSSGVDGGAPNSASDSYGTVQIGSGNSADPSVGTVQIGGPHVGPTAQLTSENGNAALGGDSAVSGDGNTANNSKGTLQVGGNRADRSTGTAQVGAVGEDENLSDSGTPAGGGNAAAPLQIGTGSGNSATASRGTAQVGGGNSVTGSNGTVQLGGSPAAATTSTAPPSSSATSPTLAPEGTAPSAAASASPSVVPSTGLAAAEPVSRVAGRSSALGGLAPKASTQGRASTTSSAAPRHGGVAGAEKTHAGPSASTLPFTGLGLAFFALLGLALLGVGIGSRVGSRG